MVTAPTLAIELGCRRSPAADPLRAVAFDDTCWLAVTRRDSLPDRSSGDFRNSDCDTRVERCRFMIASISRQTHQVTGRLIGRFIICRGPKQRYRFSIDNSFPHAPRAKEWDDLKEFAEMGHARHIRHNPVHFRRGAASGLAAVRWREANSCRSWRYHRAGGRRQLCDRSLDQNRSA